MEVILLQDVKNLGKENDTVKVEDGYARNFLIPKKLAMPSSAGGIKFIEARRKQMVQKKEKEKRLAQELAKTISKTSLTIPMESGLEDKLFGSVTTDAIYHALQQENIHIDKKAIIISEPMKKLGIYNIEVRLHPEVKADLKIWVVKK